MPQKTSAPPNTVIIDLTLSDGEHSRQKEIYQAIKNAFGGKIKHAPIINLVDIASEHSDSLLKGQRPYIDALESTAAGSTTALTDEQRQDKLKLEEAKALMQAADKIIILAHSGDGKDFLYSNAADAKARSDPHFFYPETILSLLPANLRQKDIDICACRSISFASALCDSMRLRAMQGEGDYDGTHIISRKYTTIPLPTGQKLYISRPDEKHVPLLFKKTRDYRQDILVRQNGSELQFQEYNISSTHDKNIANNAIRAYRMNADASSTTTDHSDITDSNELEKKIPTPNNPQYSA